MVANSGAGLYIVEYAIDSGTPVPVSGSITEKDFIFTNITSHHRIETVFAKQFFSDDAEETETGIVITDANEIKLGTDTVCGFRFQNIPVPQGCPLVTASLEMQTPPSAAGSPFTDKTDAMNLTVYGEATDNALQFDSALESISDRLITSGFTYSLEAGEPQSDEIVLDVSPIVSEIVNRPGWNPGNAMAFIVEASGGYRYVVSIEGSPVYSEPRPALSIIYNCEPDPMEITTLAATDVAHNSAMLGGEIADTGGTNATKIGLYWSTSPAITQDTAEGKWEETGSFEAGDFSHNVAGLSPGTTYYVMACAENEQGSFCGNKESFTTGVITTTVSSTTTTVPPPSTTTTMMFVTTVEPSTTTIAPVTTTVAPVTTTVAPVTTTVAPVTTTVAPVTTTIGSSTTTVAPVTTTIAPVTTTIATSTTTIESETTISTTSISTTTTTAPVITDRTTETVADGLWSDPAVWTAGMVPDANDVVQINPGHTVICDVASARVKGLLNYGTIRGVSSYPLTICTDPSDGFIHNKGDILGTDGTSSSQKWHTSKIIDDNGGNGTNIHLNGGAEFYNSGNIRAGSGAAGYLKGGDGGSLQIYAQHIIHTNGVVAAGNGGEGNAHQTEWDQVPDAHEYGNVNVFGGNGGSTLMKAQNVLTTTSPAHISSGQGGNAYVWCSSADCRLVYWTWEYDGRWWTGQCQCSGGKTVAGSAAGFGGDLILLASDLNVKSTASAGRGLYYEPETISTNSDTRIEAEEIFIFGGDNWTLNLNDLTEGAVSASGSITLAVGNNGVIDLTGSAKGAFKAGEQIKMLSDTLLLDDGVSPEELTDSGSEIVRGPSEILSRVFLFGPGQISGDIGTDTSVSLTLVNIGPEEDSYTLSVSDPSGSYTDALPASVTLEGLGYEELSLNLTLPSTPGDTDAFTVKVVSLKDPETVSETEISASANTFFVGSDNRGTAEDLRDAIRLMKILTGMREAVDSAEDVNGDGKIGIEEVISVLQMISAVKD
jgi:hypothetical protein